MSDAMTDADGRRVPSVAAQAAHKAFHEAWGGPPEPLDLYALSPIWERVAAAVTCAIPHVATCPDCGHRHTSNGCTGDPRRPTCGRA